jgi:hypothetical protein
LPGNLGESACHFNPGRTAPDDGEGEQAFSLFFVLGYLSAFEGDENPSARSCRIIDPL